MKKLLISAALAAAILIPAVMFTSGCTTTGTGQKILDTNQVAKIAPALETAVAGAVIYAYSRDSNSVKYLDVVQSALQEFMLSSDLSPSALQAKIYALPVKELKTPEAQLIITPILAAYKAFGQQYVQAGLGTPAAQGWLMLVQAIVNGINDGMAGVKQIQAGALTTAPSK